MLTSLLSAHLVVHDVVAFQRAEVQRRQVRVRLLRDVHRPHAARVHCDVDADRPRRSRVGQTCIDKYAT